MSFLKALLPSCLKKSKDDDDYDSDEEEGEQESDEENSDSNSDSDEEGCDEIINMTYMLAIAGL